ncbi:MAG TPA: protease inhibitor I9 family protein, partial [Bryobacteraceae bacterium]
MIGKRFALLVVGFCLVSTSASVTRAFSIQQGSPRPGVIQPMPNFHPRVGGVRDRYIVLFNDTAAGPRGRTSRVPALVQEFTRTYAIGRIRGVYNNFMKGFFATMPELVARQISLDPRVKSVEQDVKGSVTSATIQSSAP